MLRASHPAPLKDTHSVRCGFRFLPSIFSLSLFFKGGSADISKGIMTSEVPPPDPPDLFFLRPNALTYWSAA